MWLGYKEITANKYWPYYLSRTFYICIVHFVPNVCAVMSFEEYYVMFTCSYTFMTLIHYFNDCFMYASLFSYVWKNRTLVMLNDFIFAETEWEKLKVFRLSFEFWRKHNVFVKCNIRIKNKSTNRKMRFCIFFIHGY